MYELDTFKSTTHQRLLQILEAGDIASLQAEDIYWRDLTMLTRTPIPPGQSTLGKPILLLRIQTETGSVTGLRPFLGGIRSLLEQRTILAELSTCVSLLHFDRRPEL
jgi:hypothetical protein